MVNAAKAVADALERGMAKFPDDDNLLGLRAEYESALGQQPKAESLLRRTFTANPRQDWVAVRLARMHLGRSDISGAIEILKECLAAHPSSRTASFELARILINDRSDDSDSILRYLRQSFVQGDDNHAPQFWYARQLFLVGRTDDAQGYFDHISRLDVRPAYRNMIRGVVLSPNGEPVLYAGRVQTKEDSYAFVKVPQFQREVYAAASSMTADSWVKLHRDVSVHLKLGFTLRGPCAAELIEG